MGAQTSARWQQIEGLDRLRVASKGNVTLRGLRFQMIRRVDPIQSNWQLRLFWRKSVVGLLIVAANSEQSATHGTGNLIACVSETLPHGLKKTCRLSFFTCYVSWIYMKHTTWIAAHTHSIIGVLFSMTWCLQFHSKYSQFISNNVKVIALLGTELSQTAAEPLNGHSISMHGHGNRKWIDCENFVVIFYDHKSPLHFGP